MLGKLAISLAVLSAPICASAQDSLSVDEWLNTFIASCVGSGSSYTASGTVDASGGISLKKLRVGAIVEGDVTLSKSEYRLLSEGITNKISDAAAEQATEIRVCLSPVRAILLQVMAQQLTASQGLILTPRYIPSPEENRLLSILAQTSGTQGEVGRSVLVESVRDSMSDVSEIRFRQIARNLQDNSYIWETFGIVLQNDRIDTPPDFSLTAAGEDYLLESGLVK